MKKRIFRDPVHSMIEFDEDWKEEKLLVDLIDSKEVQRLRFIRQLGFSFLTFPWAEHSRFAHTLGVTHLIKRIFKRLRELKEELTAQDIIDPDGLDELYPVTMSAAILHDLGHGPLSHVAERSESGKKHEDWSVDIIKNNSTEVNQVLVSYDSALPDKIKAILKRTFRPSFVVKILSSQLDADRMDYLLRDSLMTGTGYGKYDIDWLLNVLRVGLVNSEQEVGVSAQKGRLITENFIMARYSMYLQVYYHKTTRGGEVLLDKILQRVGDLLLKEGKDVPIHPVLESVLRKKEISVAEYLELNDNIIFSLIGQWTKTGDKILQDLCNRLIRRKLFKSIDVSHKSLFEFAEKYNQAVQVIRNNGFLPEYYLAHDEAENCPYKDYYIFPAKTKIEEDTQEASLQIYLFDKNYQALEISNSSEVIRALRNREYTLERIYFPEEVQNEIQQIF